MLTSRTSQSAGIQGGLALRLERPHQFPELNRANRLFHEAETGKSLRHRVERRPPFDGDQDNSGVWMKGAKDSSQVPSADGDAVGGREVEIDDREPEATVLR